jgi:hypothetical protein
MTKEALHEPITIDRLERALAVAAYMVVLHGPSVAPTFERLERELATMRSNHDAVGRAKRLLESYNMAGGVKPVA